MVTGVSKNGMGRLHDDFYCSFAVNTIITDPLYLSCHLWILLYFIPNCLLISMFAHRWCSQDFFLPPYAVAWIWTPVRELHLFEGPLKGCSTNKAFSEWEITLPGPLHLKSNTLTLKLPSLPPTFIIFWVPDGVVRRDGEKLSVALNKLVVQPEPPWPAGMLENMRFHYLLRKIMSEPDAGRW